MIFRTMPIVAASILAFLPAFAPASAAIIAFSGTLSNDTPPPGPDASCSPGQVLISFNPGNAAVSGTSNLGRFLPSQRHCLTPPPRSYDGGIFSFAFARGDLLQGSYSGFLTPTDVGAVLDNVVNFVVTGGTGRFLDATGSFQGVGTLDRRPLRPVNNLVLNGFLDAPGVPEPASWAMLIAGFGLVGTMARRRRAMVAA